MQVAKSLKLLCSAKEQEKMRYSEFSKNFLLFESNKIGTDNLGKGDFRKQKLNDRINNSNEK